MAKKVWCIQEITPEFRKCMYDILDLYAEPYNPKRPVIALDEKPKQLLEDSRNSLPMKKGKAKKQDYEYIRRGTANIFVAVEPGGKRVTQVTEHRKRKDFGIFLQMLVKKYAGAECIRIVLDNLNTHAEKSVRETFWVEQAKEILQKVEFHYTPKHASWLNIAEIEIGVMDKECTDRRIKDKEMLKKEVKA